MPVDTEAGVYGNHLEDRALPRNATDTQLKGTDSDLRKFGTCFVISKTHHIYL